MHFFFLDSLLIEELSYKILEFLLTRLTNWEPDQPVQRISVEVHYSSKFEFRAPGLVLVISPSSKLRIVRRFFFFF